MDKSNAIEKCEEKMNEINNSLINDPGNGRLINERDMLEKLYQHLQGTKPPEIFIYVITAVNKKIEMAIGKPFFDLLNPPNHDDKEPQRWKPFCMEVSTIQDLIDSRKKEFTFSEIYLSENINEEQYIEIEKNIENIIFIIDLLALDDQNISIARVFDVKNVFRVMAPICSFLPNDIKKLMIEKRKKVFFKQESFYVKAEFKDKFDPIPEVEAFSHVLTKSLMKKQNSLGFITDSNSDFNNILRVQVNNPSF